MFIDAIVVIVTPKFAFENDVSQNQIPILNFIVK
jgi:hypothetical protein